MDYELRFFRGSDFEAVHMTARDSDVLAMERARIYLSASSHFSDVEIRRGFHFMRRIQSYQISGE